MLHSESCKKLFSVHFNLFAESACCFCSFYGIITVLRARHNTCRFCISVVQINSCADNLNTTKIRVLTGGPLKRSLTCSNPVKAFPWHLEWHCDPKHLRIWIQDLKTSLEHETQKWQMHRFNCAPFDLYGSLSHWNRRYIFGWPGLRPSDRHEDLTVWMHFK